MKYLIGSFLLALFYIPAVSQSPAIWENSTYPDEFGFQQRMAPMLQRLAARDFGKRSLASSRCPDTGLPVKTWAVKGETIISPYTGRAYIQGPTGYFGPKRRNAAGEITAFGGDPLKYDLPPATAALLLEPKNKRAKAFLSIPGNLRQQYHFACKNWARFYPLLGDEMGEEWKKAFYDAVAQYEEARRPSDGPREWNPMSYPHNLVGQPGHLLGGNTVDGGTENHKTMWRTSCLVYAQLLPDTAKVSGYPLPEARELSLQMIREYLQRLLQTGNGEYDSQIYYSHSIAPFLNLYDFSTDPEIKALAKFALDYYFLTYGLKVVDGAIAGGQKRGYLPNAKAGEMETMLWGFFNPTSRDMSEAEATIQQTTTTYRPNEVIYNLYQQNIPKPYSMRISRPFYHMDRYNAFQESYYRSESFGLGNVYMSIVDNPNQQMVWSLVAEGTKGPLALSGGQPYPQGATGHSPYTQTMQQEGTLMLLTAPTLDDRQADSGFVVNEDRLNPWHLPDSAKVPDYERANRQRYGAETLQAVIPPPPTAEAVDHFWRQKTHSAASWLWIPKGREQERWINGKCFLQLNQTYVAIIPIGGEPFFVEVLENEQGKLKSKGLKRNLSDYELLVIPGAVSGYIVEAAESSTFDSLDAFAAAIKENTQLDTTQLHSHLLVRYTNLSKDQLHMQYNPRGLKAQTSINGQDLDYENWTNGATYQSPFLNIKEGILQVTDSKQSYTIDFTGKQPVYQEN